MLMSAQRQAAVAGAAQPLKTGLKPKGEQRKICHKTQGEKRLLVLSCLGSPHKNENLHH